MLRAADLQKAWKGARRPQKYGNVPVKTEDGHFDSQAEHARWCLLKLKQRAGLIRNLEHHVKFPFVLNGFEIASYEADFVYFENEQRVVEDTKGVKTQVFELKAKMMRAFYGIEVRCT